MNLGSVTILDLADCQRRGGFAAPSKPMPLGRGEGRRQTGRGRGSAKAVVKEVRKAAKFSKKQVAQLLASSNIRDLVKSSGTNILLSPAMSTGASCGRETHILRRRIARG